MPLYEPNNAELLTQLEESRKYRAIIERVAAETNVAQAIIWGIGSRESGWGLARTLKPKGPTGTGDWTPRKKGKYVPMPPDGLGFGRGLMQIDYAAHPFARTGKWKDADANITYAIHDVLVPNVRYVRARFTLSDDDVSRAALAGYNCGMKLVAELIRLGGNVDKFTSHGDYSKNVIARGNWFVNRGEWD